MCANVKPNPTLNSIATLIKTVPTLLLGSCRLRACCLLRQSPTWSYPKPKSKSKLEFQPKPKLNPKPKPLSLSPGQSSSLNKLQCKPKPNPNPMRVLQG